MPSMNKQIFIVVLWALVGLYVGAYIAHFADRSMMIAPLLGLALAALVARTYSWTLPGDVRKIADGAQAGSAPKTTTTTR